MFDLAATLRLFARNSRATLAALALLCPAAHAALAQSPHDALSQHDAQSQRDQKSTQQDDQRSQGDQKSQRDAHARRDAQGPSSQFARVRATLAGHAGDIVSVSFSPDGAALATGAEDGTVRLWDARTGASRAVLKLAKGLDEVSVVWSPDGSLLLTDWFEGLSTKESHVQIWDARTGELRTSITGHRWGVNSYRWSPDGRRVVTAGEDGTARVWDARTGAQLTVIVFEQINTDEYTDSILKSAFTKKKLPELLGITAGFAAGGRTVVVGSLFRPPRLYTAEGKELALLLVPARLQPRPTSGGKADCERGYYEYPLTSPDGRLLVSGDGENVRVWDAETGERKYTIAGAGREYTFTPDGRTLITRRSNPSARPFDNEAASVALWDLETGKLLRSIDGLPTPVSTDVSPDGRRLVLTGYAKAKTRVLDLAAGRVVARLPWEGCTPDDWFGDGGCDPFIFSADSRLTLKLKGELQLFSTDDGSPVAALTDTNRRAAFSPTDARLLAARSKDKRSIYLLELTLK